MLLQRVHEEVERLVEGPDFLACLGALEAAGMIGALRHLTHKGNETLQRIQDGAGDAPGQAPCQHQAQGAAGEQG